MRVLLKLSAMVLLTCVIQPSLERFVDWSLAMEYVICSAGADQPSSVPAAESGGPLVRVIDCPGTSPTLAAAETEAEAF